MLLKIITLVTHSSLLLFFTAAGFPFPHPAPGWAVRRAFPVTLGCVQCLQHQLGCPGAGHPAAVLCGQGGQRSPSDLLIMVLEVHWGVKALLTNAHQPLSWWANGAARLDLHLLDLSPDYSIGLSMGCASCCCLGWRCAWYPQAEAASSPASPGYCHSDVIPHQKKQLCFSVHLSLRLWRAAQKAGPSQVLVITTIKLLWTRAVLFRNSVTSWNLQPINE